MEYNAFWSFFLIHHKCMISIINTDRHTKDVPGSRKRGRESTAVSIKGRIGILGVELKCVLLGKWPVTAQNYIGTDTNEGM